MWEIQVSDQTATFLYALLLGGILCGCYDILRAMRRQPETAAAVFVGDLLFWIVSAVTTFLFLMARTNGEIRFYVLAAQTCGFVLFRLTFSRLIFPPLAAFFRLLNRISNWISARFTVFRRVLNRFFRAAGTKLGKILKITQKVRKKLLKKAKVMLYTKQNKRRSEKTEI